MRHLTRTWLKERAPELADRLERCWECAFNEWLPAIGINKGSFNSFPHLRNLEMYLDEILFDPHPDQPDKRVIDVLALTNSESFVILCSILFHDLGRSYESKNGHSHACNSRISLAFHYRDLGLDSEELALCIGRICHYHDPSPGKDETAEIIRKSDKKKEKPFPLDLRDITITDYGVIREKLMGALLVLVDHLDGTFSRVLPHYVRMDNFGDIGKFRSRIPGVRVDLGARMVVTVVKNSQSSSCHVDSIERPRLFSLKKDAIDFTNTETGKKFFRLIHHLFSKSRKTQSQAHKRRPPLRKTVYIDGQLICHRDESLLAGKTANIFNFTPLGKRSQDSYWNIESVLVARQLAFLNTEYATETMQEQFLLATIAGNTLENANSLQDVASLLRTYGIPLYAWLIECDEHLYTCFGAETYEPLLSKDFLTRLAQAMWNKSTRVFGRRVSTYEGLASDLREESVVRVRMGVRRLAIATRGLSHLQLIDASMNEDKRKHGGIQALQDGWYWSAKEGPSLHNVKMSCIDELTTPSDHLGAISLKGTKNA